MEAVMSRVVVLASLMPLLLGACAHQAYVLDAEPIQDVFEPVIVSPVRTAIEVNAPPPPPDGLSDSSSAVADAALEIHVFSIGQADSMLIIGPAPERKTLLIDLGEAMTGQPRENFLKVAQRILDLTGRTHVDYFLLTHYHFDHAGNSGNGLAGLLDNVDPQFTIGTVIDIGEQGAEFMRDSRGVFQTFNLNMERWLQQGTVSSRSSAEPGSHAIELGGGVDIEIVAAGGRVFAGDDGALAAVAAMEPGIYEEAPGSENDLSVAVEVSFGAFEFFTAGDLNGAVDEDEPFTRRSFGGDTAETYTNVERYMVDHWQQTGRESDVEVYRADHHGSMYSSIPTVLNVLDPEFVMYSTGGAYKHPERKPVENGATTARQFVTTEISRETWPDSADFEAERGAIVGEITILVDQNGRSYSINGEQHRAYTDQEEADGADVGEEDRPTS
jgi:beta-lactamase superfamily II metal-dependent hydrolase